MAASGKNVPPFLEMKNRSNAIYETFFMYYDQNFRTWLARRFRRAVVVEDTLMLPSVVEDDTEYSYLLLSG